MNLRKLANLIAKLGKYWPQIGHKLALHLAITMLEFLICRRGFATARSLSTVRPSASPSLSSTSSRRRLRSTDRAGRSPDLNEVDGFGIRESTFHTRHNQTQHALSVHFAPGNVFYLHSFITLCPIRKAFPPTRSVPPCG